MFEGFENDFEEFESKYRFDGSDDDFEDLTSINFEFEENQDDEDTTMEFDKSSSRSLSAGRFTFDIADDDSDIDEFNQSSSRSLSSERFSFLNEENYSDSDFRRSPSISLERYRSPSLRSDTAEIGSLSSQESLSSSSYKGQAFKLTIDESLHVDMKSVSEELQEKVDHMRKAISEIGLRYKNRLQQLKDCHLLPSNERDKEARTT